MCKRIVILLLLLCLPFGSLAQGWTDRFEGCPDHIRAHLVLGGYADLPILFGASRETTDGGQYQTALMLTGEHTLLGLQWMNGSEKRILREYRCLPWPMEEITAIVPAEDDKYGEGFLLHFADGSMCELAVGLGTSWRLHAFYDTDGTQIAWTSGRMIINGQSRPSAYACWLSDLPSVRAFPTTAQEAQAVAARSWDGLDDPSLAVGSANLRVSPDSSAQSLGVYHKALMRILDECDGWYRVRIGQTEGWMNGRYVHFLSDNAATLHSAMPTAITKDPCDLRSSPDQKVILAQLPAGQEMRILAHTEEGWLHVLVPCGELDWTLNAAGIYGYVRTDEVESDLLAKGVPSADSF